MAYVAKDDIIAFIENEQNFMQGNFQEYEIILYKDSIGNALNLNQPTSFNVAIFNEDRKIFQFSQPSVSGVSTDLDVDLTGDSGKIKFAIDESMSVNMKEGDLYAQVSVYYENYYPRPKNYLFPRLFIGQAINNPNIDNGSGDTGGNTGGNTGGDSNTVVNRPASAGEFMLEFVDGSEPTSNGMASIDSNNPSEATSIVFRNLDKNGIRLSALENFLTNRIVEGSVGGVITINDMSDTNLYAIYKISSWERLDLTPGGGDSENTDGIKVNLELEAVSTGPGVTVDRWSVGQTISYNLDAHGISQSSIIPIIQNNQKPDGILTYVDKNISPMNTSGNYARTGVTISYSPYQDSYVLVEVNGISVSIGDGTRDKNAYFSGNGGDTAATIEEIRANDELFWNSDIAGYPLEEGDSINLTYEAKSEDLR